MKLIVCITFLVILRVVFSAHSDDFHNEKTINATSMCYNGGHAISSFISSPVYYIGYAIYCIVYPVIVVVQWIQTVAGWFMWFMSLPFRLVAFIVGIVFYALWWLLTIIPWLFVKLLLFILAIFGKVIANVIFTLSLIALLIIVYKRTGTFVAAILALLIAVAAGMTMLYGWQFLLGIVLCPMRFVWGIFGGIGEATVYLRAVTTLSYANV